MEPRSARRILGLAIVAVAMLCPGPGRPRAVLAGLKRAATPAATPAIPLDQVASHARDSVAEVIRDANFHRLGKSDTFPCNPRLYMKLLNEPPITLALWQDLASTPATLRQVGPDRFSGSDGAGTVATWEFVLRSPRLNVLLCDLDYTSPRGNAHLQGRIVLVVRSGYFREVNNEFWVQHEIEAFAKVDSRGWKAVAVTIRPLIEKVLEDQVQEAGLFVSLMGRLVETYPNWAIGVANQQPQIPADSRKSFIDVVNATRRAGASDGRPVVADSGATRMK